MSKKLVHVGLKPSEILPDPLGQAKGAAITGPLSEIPAPWDIPASRLFSNLTTDTERDIRRDTEGERADGRDQITSDTPPA